MPDLPWQGEQKQRTKQRNLFYSFQPKKMKKIFYITIKKGEQSIIEFSGENINNIKKELRMWYNQYYQYKPEAGGKNFFWLLWSQKFEKNRYNYNSYSGKTISNYAVGRERKLKEIISIMLGEAKGDELNR